MKGETRAYRVTVKVRNNRILKAIESVGGQPGAKWCRSVGLCYAAINDLINMTLSPIADDGSLRKQAAALCEVTGFLPDELWSAEQVRPLERNFSELEMSYEQVMSTLADHETGYIPDLDGFELPDAVKASLSELTPQQRRVVELRYGIGGDEMTLAEVGSELGLSRERVRQIESKAMRTLRCRVDRPGARAMRLKEIWDGGR